jgi:hypothetical protein
MGRELAGSLPPQKWPNFYSQMLAKFAVGGEPTIRFIFEAAVHAAQAKATLDKARVRLRELGLNDDVTKVEGIANGRLHGVLEDRPGPNSP